MVVKASANGARKTNRGIACVGGLWRDREGEGENMLDIMLTESTDRLFTKLESKGIEPHLIGFQ